MFLNESITINNTKDKYIFWDIDGTIAPYHFYHHVGDPNDSDNGMSIKEIEKGIFFRKKAIKTYAKSSKRVQSKKKYYYKPLSNTKRERR